MMPSALPQTTSVGAAMRWLCFFRPLSGIGQTNLPVQACAQMNSTWASTRAFGIVGRAEEALRRIAGGIGEQRAGALCPRA